MYGSQKKLLESASELYLKHNNHHKATYEHQDRVSGVLTVESLGLLKTLIWIKSNLYGFEFAKRYLDGKDEN
jgi:hypothetical protein